MQGLCVMKKDFSKLKQFYADLKDLSQYKKDIFLAQMANDLAAMFLAEVKKRTPVGKGTFEVVGYYKRGKNKGKPKLRRISQGGSLRRAWRIKSVVNHRNYYIAVVHNNMEYASYVENGHRQHVGQYVPVLGKRLKKSFVEGQHMMKLSAELIEQEGQAYVNKKFYEFLKENLHA